MLQPFNTGYTAEPELLLYLNGVTACRIFAFGKNNRRVYRKLFKSTAG